MKDNAIKTQDNGRERSIIITVLRKAYNHRLDILIINLSVWFFHRSIGMGLGRRRVCEQPDRGREPV